MLFDDFYIVKCDTSDLLLRLGVILDKRQSLLSHVLLWPGEADRELGTDLDVSNAFVLQADEREGCRSSCVITESQLSLLIRTPYPSHIITVHDTDMCAAY